MNIAGAGLYAGLRKSLHQPYDSNKINSEFDWEKFSIYEGNTNYTLERHKVNSSDPITFISVARYISKMAPLDNVDISRFEWENVDKNLLPSNIPEVDEVGATSAPLLSASYFIGAKCKPYNDDFMMCKSENNGGTLDCLKEGRRVTRCAVNVLQDLNKYCFDEFKLHYECLEQNNHRLGHCRYSEEVFNKCVFANLKLEKKIPGVAEQIQLNKSPIFQGGSNDKKITEAFLLKKEESKEA